MPHWLIIDLEATTDDGGWPVTEMEVIEIGDMAAPITEVWPLFERWLGQHQPRLEGWASWGDYDRVQLELEWQRHGLASALGDTPHVNLKQRFAKARRLEKPLGLNGALQLAGMQFNGQQHRALEDARNTARLLPLILPV